MVEVQSKAARLTVGLLLFILAEVMLIVSMLGAAGLL